MRVYLLILLTQVCVLSIKFKKKVIFLPPSLAHSNCTEAGDIYVRFGIFVRKNTNTSKLRTIF